MRQNPVWVFKLGEERGPVFCPAGGSKTNFLGNMAERAGEQAQGSQMQISTCSSEL